MKVIFLDIDGVLNTINTFKKRYEYWQKTNIWTLEIDEFRVKSLKEIVNKTNAKIVLSSSWRCFWSLENETLIPLNDKAREFTNLLKKYNLDIYSITPYDKNRIRQKEINQWLNNHNDIESFVILDDESYDLMGLSEFN